MGFFDTYFTGELPPIVETLVLDAFDGPYSTTATQVGDQELFLKFPNAEFYHSDLTFKNGGEESGLAHLPFMKDGVVNIPLTEAEYVIGATIHFDDRDRQWSSFTATITEITGVTDLATHPISRRHRQITKAFERDLRKHGVPIAIVRGGFSDASCAIHTQPKYSTSDDEGFVTINNTEYFLMRRSDYRSASQVTQPQVGDSIVKTATGETFTVINDDDGNNLDDTQPEIDKLRIPVRRVAAWN